MFNGTSAMSGWGKADWFLVLFALPFLGILIYMIARPKNTEQGERMMERAQTAQSRLVGGSAVDDTAKAPRISWTRAPSRETRIASVKAKARA
jgi:hypothetical protein